MDAFAAVERILIAIATYRGPLKWALCRLPWSKPVHVLHPSSLFSSFLQFEYNNNNCNSRKTTLNIHVKQNVSRCAHVPITRDWSTRPNVNSKSVASRQETIDIAPEKVIVMCYVILCACVCVRMTVCS